MNRSPTPTIDLMYFAHPVVGDATGAPDELAAVVRANLQRARRWIRFLLYLLPDIAFEMSWIQYVELLPDRGVCRERGLRDDTINAARCDAIVICGGFLSTGMLAEMRGVLLGCKPMQVPPLMVPSAPAPQRYVLDLLDMGDEPPVEERWTDPTLIASMQERLMRARERGPHYEPKLGRPTEPTSLSFDGGAATNM